jgi:hypothetical protein
MGESPVDAGYACGTGFDLGLTAPIIVVPVHVHVLASSNGTLPLFGLSEQVVRSWIDPLRPDTDRALQFAPDPIWKAAGIQFSLAGYDVIRTDGLHEYLLTDDEIHTMRQAGCGASRLRSLYEANHRGRPGLHVYLGGRIGRLSTLPGLTGFDRAYGFKCPATGGCNAGGEPRFIAIDAYNLSPIVGRGTSKSTLAHELGHFLGLAHTNEPASCGDALGPFDHGAGSCNLMIPGGCVLDVQLTASQAAHARNVACEWLRMWRVPSAACA